MLAVFIYFLPCLDSLAFGLLLSDSDDFDTVEFALELAVGGEDVGFVKALGGALLVQDSILRVGECYQGTLEVRHWDSCRFCYFSA